MKIAVFGAGAVGGHLAARLARSGVDIGVVARGKHLEAIKKVGLTLQVEDESFTQQINAVEDPVELGIQDFVIISVKGTVLGTAITACRPMVGDQTRVMFAMNGLPWWFTSGLSAGNALALEKALDPEGLYRALVPLERVVWSVVNSGGAIVAPGVIRNTTPKSNTHTLAYPDGHLDSQINDLAAMLTKAGFNATVTDDLRPKIWAKLLINAGQAMVCAITERNNHEVVSDPETRAVVVACMREILAIGEALGMKIEADPIDMTEPSKVAAHRSSFLQDLQAGRPLELSTTILAVRDVGRVMKLNSPHLETVAALVAARSYESAKIGVR